MRKDTSTTLEAITQETEKYINKLISEPIFPEAPDGTIVLSAPAFVNIVSALGRNHSGLTLLVPIAKIKENGEYRQATVQEVLEWANEVREKEMVKIIHEVHETEDIGQYDEGDGY